MEKTDLTALSLAELKALADKKKVKLPAGAKKADIVAILASFKGTAAPKTKKAEAKKAAPAAVSVKKTAPEQKVAKAAEKKVPAAKEAALKKAAERPAMARKPEATPRAPKEATARPGKTPVREWKMPAGAEEPLMAQTRVAESKYYTGPEEQRPAASYQELPQAYGEDRVALMARDPYWAYVYWEATPERIDREKGWLGWSSKLVVRIYDVTGVQFDGTNAVGYYDQEVFDRAGSWYFDLGRPTHSFCADIGLLAPDGRFVTLARSNYITMPRDGVSDVLDEEWMLVDEEFWKLYGFQAGLSSPQVQELWRRRYMQEITSPGTFSRQKAKRK